MTRSRPLKPAFTIGEVLISLILFTIFLTLAGQLFRSTILVGSASENLSNTSSRIDSALFQLRADVWNSKSIAVPTPQSVDLTLADGRQISWKIDPDQGVIRAEPNTRPQIWQTIGSDWTFSTDPISLTITDKSPAPTRLISQLLLAETTHS
jgi:hypothetical protein